MDAKSNKCGVNEDLQWKSLVSFRMKTFSFSQNGSLNVLSTLEPVMERCIERRAKIVRRFWVLHQTFDPAQFGPQIQILNLKLARLTRLEKLNDVLKPGGGGLYRLFWISHLIFYIDQIQAPSLITTKIWILEQKSDTIFEINDPENSCFNT